MKPVKSIEFRMTAKGQGVVNFSDKTEVSVIKHSNNELMNEQLRELKNNDNVKYAKHIIDEDGNLKIMVSSESFMKHAFNLRHISNLLEYDKALYYRTLLQPRYILKGYMSPTKYGTLAKSSTITLPNFIQSNNVQPTLTIHTTDESGLIDGKKSKTSMHVIEQIGDIEYKLECGIIDLHNLQFIYADSSMGNKTNVFEDDVEIFNDVMQLYFKKNKKYAFSKYNNVKNSDNQFAINGYLFDNDEITQMVKLTLENISTTEINKAHSYFRVEDVEIKFNRGIDDLKNPVWYNITNPEVENFLDLDELEIETEYIYEKE